ncbi:hypothetical protein TYRP_012602 [Tyrophagus putrescentiae]|nr:hypothetical protein TYRP_012602 [Tyrophagus putrescentiae]
MFSISSSAGTTPAVQRYRVMTAVALFGLTLALFTIPPSVHAIADLWVNNGAVKEAVIDAQFRSVDLLNI